MLKEPCLAHMTCTFCEDDDDCAEIKESYEKDAYKLQDINKYGASIEYSCGPGMEFLVDEATGETSPTEQITCGWDGTWEPTDQLKECSCK